MPRSAALVALRGRPDDLPSAERYEHGTVARYVSGCRCKSCREALRQQARDRARRVVAAAADVEPNPGPPQVKQVWRTRRDGSPYMIDVSVCPGTGGKACVVGGAWLKGGRRVCVACVDRAAVWNGMVNAEPVRAHLKKLARQGVGHKSVAEAADVGRTALAKILWSGKTLIRARAAARVLAVTKDAIADGGRVPAAPTWKLIRELLEAGLTRGEVAQRLGTSRTLQLSRRQVLASTALAVRKLHARVMADAPGRFVRDPADPRQVDATEARALVGRIRELTGWTNRELARRAGLKCAYTVRLVRPRCAPATLRRLRELHATVVRQAEVDERARTLRELEEGPDGGTTRPPCADCGLTHTREERAAALLRMLPCELAVIRERRPCLYAGLSGERTAYRDLHLVGAVREGSVWGVPAAGKEAAHADP